MAKRWLIIGALVAALVVGYLIFQDQIDYDWVDSLGGGGSSPKKESHLLTSEEARAQQLLPQVQTALQQVQDALRAEGIDTYIGSTRRNQAEQDANVAKGVSATKNSWHLLGRAVDLYPKVNGQPDLQGKNVDLFRRMHEVAAQYGWRGLAFNPDGSKRYINTVKGKVWDGGHIEFPEGMTFAQAARAGGSNVG
jgi:hypothetical protein